MDQPGRPSAASLSVVAVGLPQRPEPPECLTEAQGATWRAIVATKAPDWFKADTQPLLIAYCKAVDVHARFSGLLEAALDAAEPDVMACKQLGEMVAKQAGVMASMATKMRLTPQSRYTPQAAATSDRKTASEQRKPWEK
jgi:hypothetical protein